MANFMDANFYDAFFFISINLRPYKVAADHNLIIMLFLR